MSPLHQLSEVTTLENIVQRLQADWLMENIHSRQSFRKH